MVGRLKIVESPTTGRQTMKHTDPHVMLLLGSASVHCCMAVCASQLCAAAAVGSAWCVGQQEAGAACSWL